MVKPLIDRTAEAAFLCKEATKDQDGTVEKMREYYKENGSRIQQILTPGAKAVNKLHAKYPKLAEHLCQHQHDEVKTPEPLMDLICASGTTEKSVAWLARSDTPVSLQSSIFDTSNYADWLVSEGPGALPEIDWTKLLVGIHAEKEESAENFQEGPAPPPASLPPSSSSKMSYATPKGSGTLLENVTDQDVSIAHRDPHDSINRSVYDWTK